MCVGDRTGGSNPPLSALMLIEVSIGEFIDKISILWIKLNRIQDEKKLQNIQLEYDYLISQVNSVSDSILNSPDYAELVKANEIIWDCEENFRAIEKTELFDERFINTARTIHSTNDLRADIKKRINLKYNSSFIEEKSHRN